MEKKRKACTLSRVYFRDPFLHYLPTSSRSWDTQDTAEYSCAGHRVAGFLGHYRGSGKRDTVMLEVSLWGHAGLRQLQ